MHGQSSVEELVLNLTCISIASLSLFTNTRHITWLAHVWSTPSVAPENAKGWLNGET